MTLIKSINQLVFAEWQQKLRFASVGVINTGVSYLLFVLLYHWSGNEILANIVSYMIGMVISFGLNRRVVFKSQHRGGQFLPFCISNLASMALSTGTLYLLVHYVHVYVYLAQVFAIMVSMTVNYICYRAIFSKGMNTTGTKK